MKNEPFSQKVMRLRRRWKQDYTFKTMVSTNFSFGATALFALYNGFLGIRLLSVWHGSICVFYLLLAVIRGGTLLTEKHILSLDEQQKAYHRQIAFRISAVMLLLLSLTLATPISLMVLFEKPVSMGLIPALAMATYTTYKIITSSVHIRKQRRIDHNNILVTELRVINFIDALVSILTLQNTLIMVNNTSANHVDMLILAAVSSTAIYLVIVLINIWLLIKGFKRKR